MCVTHAARLIFYTAAEHYADLIISTWDVRILTAWEEYGLSAEDWIYENTPPRIFIRWLLRKENNIA